MPTRRKYDVFIVVHKGDPVDFQKYRHTGIWFVPVNSGSTYYFHVKGTTLLYQFEMGKNFDPTTTKNFAKKIQVGTTRHSMTSDELIDGMKDVPVKNNDAEFNCHAWVDLALGNLRGAHFLTKEECEEGIDAMEATMEAEDEDIG